jgi:hypothetical protein
VQQSLYVFGGAHAASYGERDKYLIGDRFYHGQNQVSLIGRGSDIQKSDLIGTLLVIATGHRHWVARIAEPDKVGAFHDPPRVYIEARNDPLGEHLPP